MLAEVAKQKGISLCGIQRDQTTADFSNQYLKPPDAILLASDLSQEVVAGALTKLDLSDNQMCGLNHVGFGAFTAEGITAMADALRVNGTLTALNLSSNRLNDEDVSAVCKAIQSNKETKLASLNFKDNGIGPVGANAVAAMVAATGALTVANLLGNELDAESAKMLAEVAKQKGISLCGIRRDQTTADFRDKDLKPPDAILLASDLSQAVVTGALTKIELSRNFIGEEGKALIREALQGKAGFELLF
ncbi:nlrc3 receptor [Chrysochromulina tobinii]|uniref:Nlrc3 receptor n=1 Tax=Chrysochromulina tobinii TaxID=1460289 RepID=A0A0M0K6Y1_9EUKA|nr:nlrc3 receptor [Chrysochromulina tobinii]|eukprot:KOO34554.1 nlrc3 receptor [Chrysochromulina sp. CCMP291]